MNYNEAKTAELLKNLGESGATVEIKDLSKILCKKVVGVRLNGRRGKMSTTVSIKSLGLNDYDKIDTFVNSKMKKSVISFFDKKVIAEFDNVINKVRQALYNASSSSDGTIYYMTEDNFSKFKKNFDEKYDVEYHKIKEALIANLASYKASFETELKTFVNSRGLDSSEADILYRSILSKFPTEEQMKNDCSLDYYVIAFPVFNEENISGINSEIALKMKEDKDNSAVEVFYDMVGNNLKDAFELVYKCMECVDTTASMQSMKMVFNPAPKTKGFIYSKMSKLLDDNRVLKNDNLSKIVEVTERTFKHFEDNTGNPVTNQKAQETCEQLLGVIYGYAKYLGLEEKITPIIATSEYDEDDLVTIGEVTNIDNL